MNYIKRLEQENELLRKERELVNDELEAVRRYLNGPKFFGSYPVDELLERQRLTVQDACALVDNVRRVIFTEIS